MQYARTHRAGAEEEERTPRTRLEIEKQTANNRDHRENHVAAKVCNRFYALRQPCDAVDCEIVRDRGVKKRDSLVFENVVQKAGEDANVSGHDCQADG